MLKRHKKGLLLFFLGIFIGQGAYTQVPQIFTRADFDLKGPVKSCQLITSYGSEEFEFDKKGLLTKLVTRFAQEDYSVSYYKYQDSTLLESRHENYVQGQLDKATSIAHLYALDTVPVKKITERIFSYQKDVLDQYEYYFDATGRLTRIVRSNEEGVDETEVSYSQYKDEETVAYSINGVIQKSERTSYKNKDTAEELRLVLRKEFLNGEPVRAIEEITDASNRLKERLEYLFDTGKNQFALSQKTAYTYDENGNLDSETTTLGRAKSGKTYIYQFDGSEHANWIKQIITPDNTYKTRKITYFEEEKETGE